MPDVVFQETVQQILVPEGGIYNYYAGSANTKYELLTISSNNQTVFNLANIPVNPSQAFVYLNGVKSRYSTEFIISSSVFTWLNSGVRLATTDTLEIYYI